MILFLHIYFCCLFHRHVLIARSIMFCTASVPCVCVSVLYVAPCSRRSVVPFSLVRTSSLEYDEYGVRLRQCVDILWGPHACLIIIRVWQGCVFLCVRDLFFVLARAYRKRSMSENFRSCKLEFLYHDGCRTPYMWEHISCPALLCARGCKVPDGRLLNARLN